MILPQIKKKGSLSNAGHRGTKAETWLGTQRVNGESICTNQKRKEKKTVLTKLRGCLKWLFCDFLQVTAVPGVWASTDHQAIVWSVNNLKIAKRIIFGVILFQSLVSTPNNAFWLCWSRGSAHIALFWLVSSNVRQNRVSAILKISQIHTSNSHILAVSPPSCNSATQSMTAIPNKKAILLFL